MERERERKFCAVKYCELLLFGEKMSSWRLKGVWNLSKAHISTGPKMKKDATVTMQGHKKRKVTLDTFSLLPGMFLTDTNLQGIWIFSFPLSSFALSNDSSLEIGVQSQSQCIRMCNIFTVSLRTSMSHVDVHTQELEMKCHQETPCCVSIYDLCKVLKVTCEVDIWRGEWE